MLTAITLENIQSFKNKINKDDTVKMARNAAMRNEVTALAMDWEYFRRIDHAFGYCQR